MPKDVMLIDGNSIGNQANNTKILKVGEQETQAVYGFLNILGSILAKFGQFEPIILWDGVSWRKSFFSDYKEIRDRKETKNEILLQERKAAFATQRPMIQEASKLLGIPQLLAQNMEADDLAAMLSKRYLDAGGRVLLITGDKDWIQLVQKGCIWKDQINDRMVTQSTFKAFTGLDTPRQFVEMKAISGDQGDSVPGIGGIGEKGAIDFLNTYGSMTDFINGVTFTKAIDFESLPKKFKAIIEDEDKLLAFHRNMALVDLHTTSRPPIQGLATVKGEPSLEEFRSFCETWLFNSILGTFDRFVQRFPVGRMTVAEAA